MLFSRSTEYAIRAMTFLAQLPAGRLAGAREISEAEQIPMPFLWKILQNLARHRLIRSFKGIRGGYELAIPAEKITLRMIINPLEGIERMNDCILGLAECSEENACPLHETWRELRSQLSSMLEEKNLAELARVAQRRNADVPA